MLRFLVGKKAIEKKRVSAMAFTSNACNIDWHHGETLRNAIGSAAKSASSPITAELLRCSETTRWTPVALATIPKMRSTAAACGVEACVVRLATMHWAAAAYGTISSRVSAHDGTELVMIVYANPR